MANPPAFASSCSDPELWPLPSTGVTRLLTVLWASPTSGCAPPALTGCGLAEAGRLRREAGSPVLSQDSCCAHAVTHAPAEPTGVRFARRPVDGSLPLGLAGSTSAIAGFGTCSVFMFITACALAEPLARPFSARASDRTVTGTPASLASGWSDSCRVGLLPPTGVLHLSTAHQTGRADFPHPAFGQGCPVFTGRAA